MKGAYHLYSPQLSGECLPSSPFTAVVVIIGFVSYTVRRYVNRDTSDRVDPHRYV